MKRRDFVLGSAAAAAVAGVASTEGCGGNQAIVANGPSGPVVEVPYVLNVQYATTTFGGRTLRTRTYNGKTMGPILETKPGSVLSVRVVNALPPNPPAKPPTGAVRIPAPRNAMEAMRMHTGATKLSSAIDPMNDPHDFNTTNLHTHGIQTTPHLFMPIGTSDPNAMMLDIKPGEEFLYNLPVPSDHPSGLHWYHPHHHGSTHVQVSGGMAGLIVVRGPIDQVPEIAAAREVFMVMQTLNVNRSASNPNLYEWEPIAYKPPSEGGYTFGTSYTVLTVNGKGVYWIDNAHPEHPERIVGPSFQMRPGEVIRLRILNGTTSFPLPLTFAGLEVYQIGFDGVNLLAPVQSAFDFSGVVTPANITSANVRNTFPANRIELLIRAPKEPGRYAIEAAPTSGISFGDTPRYHLADVVVSGDPMSMSIPSSLPKPVREYPLIKDVASHRTIEFSQGPTTKLLTGFGFYMNGQSYAEKVIAMRPALNSAEEWTIVNKADEAHPFHVHVNSFQLFAINGVKLDKPEVWDTFFVPPMQGDTPGSITIRLRFLNFRGKTVNHCHILEHEDTGMMQNFLIT